MTRLWMLLCGLLFFSCTRNSSTEKYQTTRDKVENVHNWLKKFDTDSILIGNNARMYMLADYLLIADHRGYDKQIHVFDKNSFRHLASTAPLGQGPTEITVLGHVAVDEQSKKFYVSDHGKQKIFSYDIDSVLADPDYTPEVKLTMDIANFPSEYEYISDTLCIGNHSILRLDTHCSLTYLCSVIINDKDYGKRKSKLPGGVRPLSAVERKAGEDGSGGTAQGSQGADNRQAQQQSYREDGSETAGR